MKNKMIKEKIKVDLLNHQLRELLEDKGGEIRGLSSTICNHLMVSPDEKLIKHFEWFQIDKTK
jgi:hypothetical protein